MYKNVRMKVKSRFLREKEPRQCREWVFRLQCPNENNLPLVVFDLSHVKGNATTYWSVHLTAMTEKKEETFHLQKLFFKRSVDNVLILNLNTSVDKLVNLWHCLLFLESSPHKNNK